MKKIIMLSAFVLGTITASASNDLFKNYYAEKTNEQLPFEKNQNFKIRVWRNLSGFTWTLVYDQVHTCITNTQAQNITEGFRQQYFPELIMAEAHLLSNCTVVFP